MKFILTEQTLDVPADVEVEVKARNVRVKGPLGELKRSFKHLSMEIFLNKDATTNKKKVVFRVWQAGRKQAAVVGSVRSSIRNMIKGVRQGFKFKMVLAYAHFPIHVNVLDGGKALQIKNFLGIKMNRRINCLTGVTVEKKEEEKNLIVLKSTDLNAVSQTCALIRQSCKVPDKDLRQFLDGIYVSEKRLTYAE